MSRITIALCLMTALLVGCATSSQDEEAPEPSVVSQPAAAPAPPPAAPAPEPVAVSAPMLPDTASSLPLLGLAGAGAIGLAGALRALRRFLA